jgi:transposase
MNSGYENWSKEELIAEIVSLKSANESLEISQLQLQAELTQIKRMIYGTKSERFIAAVSPEQTALNFGIESSVAAPVQTQTITYTRKESKNSNTLHTGRTALPAHLKRIEIVIEPAGDVSGLTCIGKEITEELEFEPGKFYVNQYIRPKYVKSDREGILIGELPSRPIEKGIPGPGLLASIIIDKYQDHLPCYRQLQRFEREGVRIAPSTISEWIGAGCALIEPLYEVLKKEVLSQGYLQADETPIKVLDKNKKGTTHRGYYWVYHSPPKGLVLFDYRPGRDRAGPREILKDFRGYLQTDGYGVYEGFDSEQVRLFHCMAHARRMFEEALHNDKIRAEHVLVQMQMLYAIERYARENNISYLQRQELREKDAMPVLEGLRQWFKENTIQVTPKSKMGQAITYSLSRWDKLCLYVKDGTLEIDNNPTENAIRPVALGRKNYLFAGSHNAAQRAAMLYSLLATCKKKGIEPYKWLRHILTVIPDFKVNRLNELLPGSQP